MHSTDPSKPPLPTRRWLTPDEAAAYLGKSRRQFDRAKFAVSYRLGPGSPMYDIHEIDRAMQQDKEKHAPTGDDVD